MKFIKIGDFVINTDFVESVTLNKVGTEVQGVRLFMAESRLKGEWFVIKNETLDSMLEKLNQAPEAILKESNSKELECQPDLSQAPMKYNWSKALPETKWIATDSDGNKVEYSEKPDLGRLNWSTWDVKQILRVHASSEFTGHWGDSLEERK